MFGVNGGSAASHQSFAAKYGLTAPLLVDPDLRVTAAYDCVLGFGPLRIANRTVVGIGTDGRIRYYQRGMPSTDDILAGLEAPRR